MSLLIRMRDRLPLHHCEPLLAGTEMDRAIEAAVAMGPAYEEAVRQQFNRQFVQAMLLCFNTMEEL